MRVKGAVAVDRANQFGPGGPDAGHNAARNAFIDLVPEYLDVSMPAKERMHNVESIVLAAVVNKDKLRCKTDVIEPRFDRGQCFCEIRERLLFVVAGNDDRHGRQRIEIVRNRFDVSDLGCDVLCQLTA